MEDMERRSNCKLYVSPPHGIIPVVEWLRLTTVVNLWIVTQAELERLKKRFIKLDRSGLTSTLLSQASDRISLLVTVMALDR